MVDPSSVSGLQNIIVTDKSPKTKSSKKLILVFILFIFLITLVTIGVLYIKSRSPHKEFQEDIGIREVVPDLYPGRAVEIKESLLFRGRFAKYSKDSVTLSTFLPVGAETDEIKLDKTTVFGCIPQYWIAPDGTKVDRLNMFITTKGNEEIGDIPNPPDSKDFEWFKSTAQSGEAVEVRYIKTQEGDVIPRIIYIYEETCPQ